ncbi:MAG: hypothetical protein HC902_02935 [Calothrix sp. SM1_5_4]|nr:hypothetical protein [Calothrix sp. SM1_5_4]
MRLVCGLHSPILGETEVFGQFKIFAQSWIEREARRASLVQRVLGDAKTLRTRYLSGLGTQSYGSWLRKNLTAKKVHVLGAGHLTKEILPYLEKQAEVVLHVRNPGKVEFFDRVRALHEEAFDHGALVIAAPMSRTEIEAWLKAHPCQIFDLRDNSSEDAVCSPAPRYALKDIFSQIERTKARLIPVVNEIKEEIVSRSEKLAGHAQVRPQGWDDLCA